MTDREGIISLADRRLARERAAGRPGVPPQAEPAPKPPSRTPVAAAFCAGMTLLMLGLLAITKLEGQSVLNLPGSAREELTSHGLDQLRTACADPAVASREHCVAQARLLMMLPECTGACQTEASSVLNLRR